jgi:hypothetical protein
VWLCGWWRWRERTEDRDEDEKDCFDHLDGLKLVCVNELIAVCLVLFVISYFAAMVVAVAVAVGV